MLKDKIKISIKDNILNIFLFGKLSYKDAKELNIALSAIKNFKAKILLNLNDLLKIDYACVILLKNALKDKNCEIIGASEKIDLMFKLIDDENIDFNYIPEHKKINFFALFGEKIYNSFENLRDLSSFLGEFIVKLAKICINPKNLRLSELSNYIKDGGVSAIFIVSLTSFLIGIVLAYLGSSMLASFGAGVFIVEIMGVLTLREVGPLIAAIVIAGRSSSSFTAQIGAMKIAEEIDAMKTMGFDPFNFLVLVRVIAMILAVPIVIFLADGVSIFGQMIVCKILFGIEFSEYLSRFRELVEIRHFAVGMIKAPFFGAVIAIIGCLRGLNVKQNAQSLGDMTTLSVVNAIFWVIMIDAFFAILFNWMGV